MNVRVAATVGLKERIIQLFKILNRQYSTLQPVTPTTLGAFMSILVFLVAYLLEMVNNRDIHLLLLI